MATKKSAPTPSAPTPPPTGAAPADAAAPKAKKEVDPNVVTLAEICKELGIVGTAARRKLRAKKAQKDGRWQWQKGSKELDEVKKLLTAKEEPAEPTKQ